MTEQGAVLVAEPVRAARSSLIALTIAIAGFAVSGAVATVLLVPRVAPGRYLPTFTLPDDWQLVAGFAGIVGAGLALISLVGGLAALLASERQGGRRRGTWALALSLASLALVGFAWWFVNQPPYLRYGLEELPAAERARLDGLEPAAVVTTYFGARDLSVDYWLSDRQSQRSWHNASWDPALSGFYPPWGVLAGADDLTVAPLKDGHHPADDTERSFRVTYIAAATGQDSEWFVVVRRVTGGPWRVEEVQFP